MQVKKILDALHILDDGEKIRLAPYFFVSDVYMRWRTVKITQLVGPIIWTDFVTLFMKKHFPKADLGALKLEFTTLKRGDMMMAK